MRNRLIAALLAVFLVAGLLPANVLATELETTEAPAILMEGEGTLIPTADLPDNDALYEAYLHRLFYGDPGVSFYGAAAGEQLTGNAKIVYTALKKQAALVASGQKSSTVFEINANTASEPLTFETTNADEADAILSAEMDLMLNALLADCPYELYWFDKVSGIAYSYYMEYGNGNILIRDMTFHFKVAKNYQDSDYLTFDTRKAAVAQAAADNAKSIVNRYAAAPVRDKLTGYKNEICALVSYNDDAANSGNFSQNDDPWELIYVFDGIPSTNVVCEGYSKAFQYLCDLGGLDCYSVDGTMAGPTNVGSHMWNIVKLDGMNYLVDVTNSDSGTIGQDGSLFLAHGTPSSMDFTLTYTDGSKEYITMEGYTVGSGNVFYAYNEDTLSLWGSSGILDISTDQTPETPELITGTCGENLTWTFDEATGTLTYSGTGSMQDNSFVWPFPLWYSEFGGPDMIRSVVIEEGVTSIADYAFRLCENLTSISIPESVTTIGTCAFENCKSLTNISFPDSVTAIPYGCFKGCTNLQEFVISDTVTTIGPEAFMRCSSMKSMTIPRNVTSIARGAFESSGLTEITFEGGILEIGNGAFVNLTATVYYPAGYLSFADKVTQSYGGNITWVPYGDPLPLPGGICGDNLTWTFDEATGTLTISGTGDMDDYVYTYMPYPENRASVNYPWGDIASQIQTIIVEEGVTGIGEYAFWNMKNVTSVSIAEGVTEIRKSAFSSCSGLTAITLPDNMTSIGSSSFGSCSSLESIHIPGGITTVEAYTFDNCPSLKNVTLPDSLISIETFAFSHCTALESIIIPDGVTTIGGYAFNYCSALESAVIPDSVTTIGWYAFDNCALTSVNIPNSLTFLDHLAFSCCNLTSVEIPASVTKIGHSPFASCMDLKEITFVGNAPEFDSNSFINVTSTVYYPVNNATWTEKVMQNYGGTITWVPYDAVELGDATGDGEIDFSDAVLVLEYSAFLIDESQLSLSACDVNGDGFVDFSDAVLILEYSAFLITEFPAASPTN